MASQAIELPERVAPEGSKQARKDRERIVLLRTAVEGVVTVRFEIKDESNDWLLVDWFQSDLLGIEKPSSRKRDWLDKYFVKDLKNEEKQASAGNTQ